MELCYVYGLYDPRDNKLRYVGKETIEGKRLNEHITKPMDAPVGWWINELNELKLKPYRSTLTSCECYRLNDVEIEYINKNASPDLLNVIHNPFFSLRPAVKHLNDEIDNLNQIINDQRIIIQSQQSHIHELKQRLTLERSRKS